MPEDVVPVMEIAMPNTIEQFDASISRFLPAKWGPWLSDDALKADLQDQTSRHVEDDTKKLLDDCVVLSSMLQAEITKATLQQA